MVPKEMYGTSRISRPEELCARSSAGSGSLSLLSSEQSLFPSIDFGGGDICRALMSEDGIDVVIEWKAEGIDQP